MKRKAFDCVEMMHEGGRRVQELLRGMSREEELEFWRKETQKLRELQARLRGKKAQGRPREHSPKS
jgi:hypothetical protein